MHDHFSQPRDPDLLEGEQALRRLRPELEALEAPLHSRAIHVPYAVSVLLGVQPTIERSLPLMRRYTPLANISRIANLRDYALATAFVHHRSRRTAPTDGPNYTRLITDARALYRRLGAASAHLADLGLLDAGRVAEIRRVRGNIAVGDGLLALATTLQERWPMVDHCTPIQRHELRHAAELGARLLAAVAERRQQRSRIASFRRSDGLHRRAVSRMCDVYEEARRVVAYIGWYEPDLAPLPSLVRRLAKHRALVEGRSLVEPAEGTMIDPPGGLIAAE